MAAASFTSVSLRLQEYSEVMKSYSGLMVSMNIGKSSPNFKIPSVRASHDHLKTVVKLVRNDSMTRRNFIAFSVLGGDGSGGNGSFGGNGGSGGGDEGNEGGEDSDENQNRTESLAAVAAIGRTLENLPKDLADAILEGRITAQIVDRFASLEKSFFLNWLLRFGGFRERLLADDLFLTKVGIEVGVGVFTKTAAEIQKRKEKFWKEFDFVVADVIMAIIADFMLVWLPAPTVSLKSATATSAGQLAKFLASLPDNAFQVPLRGTRYSVLQRGGAVVRNGAKLVAVGTISSLVATAVTNALQKFRGGANEGLPGVTENKVPILETSLAYGVYMGISSNLRYQFLAGVVEQRLLEPLLHDKKLALTVLSFVARTGNTFLGSLLWVDYARWVGVQESH